MLKLAELLEELLRYREATSEDTATFRWNHDKLCKTFENQINSLGDSFLKYYHIAYVVQGPRDQGVDVLLKTTVTEQDTESYVGIQVKSYFELDDRDNELSKNLKAAYHDAQSHYGSRLERYYIALCGDSVAHSKRISAIAGEFSKQRDVRVINPRYLFTFLTMPDAMLSAIADRFLKQDDVVRKQAREEVLGRNDPEIYFLLACLTWSFERGTDQLPIGFFEQSHQLQELADRFGQGELERVLANSHDTALEMYAAGYSTRVRIEEYPAIRALYYDLQVRYRESPDDLFTHLYEFLIL